jgi:hypothetical protein
MWRVVKRGSGMGGIPKVRRRTITLTQEKVIKEVTDSSETRIITGSRIPTLSSQATDTTSTSLSPQPRKTNSGPTVLVVNASHTMAEKLTLELTETLPGCTILFAPTVEIGLWIVKRRKVDVILSSATLPDGPASQIHAALSHVSSPPELLILSELGATREVISEHPGYRFMELRRVTQTSSVGLEQKQSTSAISLLGADLRNDLNNPLQEIVAMAFVATSNSELSSTAEEALGAIQRAATSMASVIDTLEDKIRGAIIDSSAA